MDENEEEVDKAPPGNYQKIYDTIWSIEQSRAEQSIQCEELLVIVYVYSSSSSSSSLFLSSCLLGIICAL